MPPKGRGKALKGPKPKRQSTQFGELDTTPTSRHLRSSKAKELAIDQPAGGSANPRPSSGTDVNASPVQPNSSPGEFEDGVDDVDLIQLDYSGNVKMESQVPDFTWSEAGSTRKRSSPLRTGDASQSPWEFDEKDSMNPFSSPRSGLERLPDTMPLPRDPTLDAQSQSQREPGSRIDFSETASTMRRSSPLLPQGRMTENWEFNDSSPQVGPLGPHPTTQEPKMAHPDPPTSPPTHLPMDEMYDATPPGSRSQILNASSIRPEETLRHSQHRFRDPTPPHTLQTDGPSGKSRLKRKQKSMKELLIDDLVSDDEEPTPCPGKTKPPQDQFDLPQATDRAGRGLPEMHQGSPTAAQESTRGKKRKQRAKTPIQFDETTKEIKEVPRKKRTTAPKPAVVSALKNPTQTSISPVTNAKKRPAPKAASKPEPAKKKRKAPPRKEKQGEPATISSSAVATVIRARAANLKEATKREMGENDESQEVMHVTQGTLETDIIYAAPDHIVISSDDDSSDFSEADAAPSWRPVPPPKSRTERSNSRAKENSGSASTKPKNPHTLPPDPKKSRPAQISAAVSTPNTRIPDTREQDKGPAEPVRSNQALKTNNRTTRSMRKGGADTKETGKATVLASRDPNRATKRVLRSPQLQHKALEKTRAVERSEVGSSRPLRKTGTTSRSFSISEVGSPVPLASDPAPFTVDSTPPDRGRQEHPSD